MATTVTTVRETGFEANGVRTRFGMLWPSGSDLMTDFSRESRYAKLTGVGGLTVYQMDGMGPYEVSYQVFFDTVADYQALDALVQQTGTLTVFDGGHTAPVAIGERISVLGTVYDKLANVLLLSLVSAGINGEGSPEGVATFARVTS